LKKINTYTRFWGDNNGAGWLVAALLLLCSSIFAQDPVQNLFNKFSKYSFEELMGEYNQVVELHDNTRADIENNMKDGLEKSTILKQDDNWCKQRQEAWENAIKSQNREELYVLIVLEYLRVGEMKEKYLEGSPQRSHNLF